MSLSPDTWIAGIALAVAVGWPTVQFFLKATAKEEADEAGADAVKLIEAQRLILNQHEIRLVRLEEQMKALPGQRDHQKLMADVKDLQGDIKVLVASMAEVRRGQDRTETQINVINEALAERA